MPSRCWLNLRQEAQSKLVSDVSRGLHNCSVPPRNRLAVAQRLAGGIGRRRVAVNRRRRLIRGPSSSSHRSQGMNGDPALLLKRFPLSAKPHVPLRLTSRSEIACEELMAPISSFPHSKLSSAVSKALQAELQVWPALAMIQKGCTCTRLQETAEVGLYCAAYSIRSVTSVAHSQEPKDFAKTQLSSTENLGFVLAPRRSQPREKPSRTSQTLFQTLLSLPRKPSDRSCSSHRRARGCGRPVVAANMTTTSPVLSTVPALSRLLSFRRHAPSSASTLLKNNVVASDRGLAPLGISGVLNRFESNRTRGFLQAVHERDADRKGWFFHWFGKATGAPVVHVPCSSHASHASQLDLRLVLDGLPDWHQ